MKLESKQTSQAAVDIAKEMFDCCEQMSDMAITIHNLQNCLTETTDAVSNYQKRSKIERNKIIYDLNYGMQMQSYQGIIQEM